MPAPFAFVQIATAHRCCFTATLSERLLRITPRYEIASVPTEVLWRRCNWIRLCHFWRRPVANATLPTLARGREQSPI
jgi:hypothetical protein